jgi:hypothetical protein
VDPASACRPAAHAGRAVTRREPLPKRLTEERGDDGEERKHADEATALAKYEDEAREYGEMAKLHGELVALQVGRRQAL